MDKGHSPFPCAPFLMPDSGDEVISLSRAENAEETVLTREKEIVNQRRELTGLGDVKATVRMGISLINKR